MLLPTSFKIRKDTIQRINEGKSLTRKMSMSHYREYLNSPEWQERVKKYKKSRCEICGTRIDLALHHFSYKHLMTERAEDFATLCEYCHFANHIDIITLRKLKNPSNATRRIISRIRDGKKLRQESMSLFLRRRYIAKYGDKNVPDMQFFRNIYWKNIRDKEYPFGYSIAHL